MIGRPTGYTEKKSKWVKCAYKTITQKDYNEYIITYLYKRKVKLNAWQDIGKI